MKIRREQDRKKPGTSTSNVVFTILALVNILSKDQSRIEEANSLLEEASILIETIDMEHTGFYLDPKKVTINNHDEKNTLNSSISIVSQINTQKL